MSTFDDIPTGEIDPADAVRRGAELLDRKVPDWRDRIDLDRLNLRSVFRCILGQVFADPDDSWQSGYSRGTEILFRDAHNDDEAFNLACAHGFDADLDSGALADLTTAWRRLFDQS